MDWPQVAIFFEVPNGLFTLRDKGVWDLIYEHISYFTPASLARAFALSGFEVLDLQEAYDGQYLCLEAAVAPDPGAPGPSDRDGDGIPASWERNRGLDPEVNDELKIGSSGRLIVEEFLDGPR